MQQRLSFEEAFQKLEKLVEKMESGGLTLEQATALYEDGLKLAQLCSAKLDAAELKITKLNAAFNGITAMNGNGLDNDEHP